MKAHKYWSVGALITMFGTYYTGYKKLKSSHKYFALSSMLCMVMAIYTGHKMITGNRKRGKFFFGPQIAALNFRKLFNYVKGLGNYSQNPVLA